MDKALYKLFAEAIGAYKRSETGEYGNWLAIWENRLKTLEGLMPSGSGIDCGTKLDLDASSEDRLVFNVSFHHMNDVGYYDGWTEHEIVVTGSLAFGIALKLSGRDRNQIKDYLYEVYDVALKEKYAESKIYGEKG